MSIANFLFSNFVKQVAIFLTLTLAACNNVSSGETSSKQSSKKGCIVSGRVSIGLDDVEGAVAYIWSPNATQADAKLPPITVVIKNGEVIPKHNYAQTGQRIKIKYLGDREHRVQLNSRKQSYGDTVGGMIDFEKTFRQSENGIPIVCGIDPKLIGYITIVPQQYAAITGKNGKFQLETAIPVGSHDLRLYHPRIGLQEKKIIVREGDSQLTVDFSFTNPKKPTHEVN